MPPCPGSACRTAHPSSSPPPPCTHHVDAAVVRGVQLQHRLPEAGPQQLVRQAQDAGGLARAGRALRRRRRGRASGWASGQHGGAALPPHTAAPAAPNRRQQHPGRRPQRHCCRRRRRRLTARMMLGMLPSSAMTCRRDTASTLPTMSLMRVGRYFSTWRARGAGCRERNAQVVGCSGGGSAVRAARWQGSLAPLVHRRATALHGTAAAPARSPRAACTSSLRRWRGPPPPPPPPLPHPRPWRWPSWRPCAAAACVRGSVASRLPSPAAWF